MSNSNPEKPSPFTNVAPPPPPGHPVMSQAVAVDPYGRPMVDQYGRPIAAVPVAVDQYGRPIQTVPVVQAHLPPARVVPNNANIRRDTQGNALCNKCSAPYPLPNGATSWRCRQCSEFNSASVYGPECSIL
ncbi:hypothetical protein H310_00280 [Aphanomyces invadans]|uniref:Uncharacterized protein n=1 Tax=Aphanomyces invadans TaxID=157072 RepID=A0A024UTF7_9STRA|nr:hypothetical protein H310_00280 [Aphanomyces invadans]ETW09801.1 hypothetical protein H310_00280 [Aphanomyces invadans]|eukprot:XP_008861212.1 hypothetical protein H310_00280 [Aphanomyces invadans]